MKVKYVLSLFLLIVIIFFPVLALYLLEDRNIYYLSSVSKNLLNERNISYDNSIINTIYAKYKVSKYDVSTFDEFQYSTIDKEISGEHVFNNNLLKLKELEDIGLLKKEFFLFIESNSHVITRHSVFRGESLNYSKKRLFLSNDNFSKAFMSFEVENITEKIISLKAIKEYVSFDKDVLEKYIDYLHLSGEDWIYKNNSITSKSKGIEIKIENINNFVSISIIPYS